MIIRLDNQSERRKAIPLATASGLEVARLRRDDITSLIPASKLALFVCFPSVSAASLQDIVALKRRRAEKKREKEKRSDAVK